LRKELESKGSLGRWRVRKQNIVVQYASMWAREVCDLRGEGSRKSFIKDTPELQKPGVYVLYRDEQPYYIGKSTRIGKRIWQHACHPRARYYHFWNMFSAFVVKDKKYLDDVEGILIATFPSGNSSTPRIPKVRLPKHIVHQLGQIRQHQVNPVTRRDFASSIRSIRRQR
jgi:hypothetical protein